MNPFRQSDFLRPRPLSQPSPARGEGEFLRRFAPEVYDSGFRVKPGMTRCWGVAGRGFWQRPAESAKNRNRRVSGDGCQETEDRNSCGASRRRNEPADCVRPTKTARRNPVFCFAARCAGEVAGRMIIRPYTSPGVPHIHARRNFQTSSSPQGHGTCPCKLRRALAIPCPALSPNLSRFSPCSPCLRVLRVERGLLSPIKTATR
jgi:hypothetical protein